MGNDEKFGSFLEFDRLDMKMENLDASLEQEAPWGKAFSLGDLKLLFKREIKEEDDPYVKKNLNFDGESFSLGDLSLERLTANSEGMVLRLEDPTGRAHFKSEDQSIELEDLNMNDLDLSLTGFSVEELIIEKLIGCDFGMKIFPFHTGISSIQEAEVTAKGVTVSLEFEEDGSDELEIMGNLDLGGLKVNSDDLSLEDLDIEDGKLDLRDLGSNSGDISVLVEDFELDLDNMNVGFGTLRLENSYSKDLVLTDVNLNFGNLIGKLKNLGLDFLNKKI